MTAQTERTDVPDDPGQRLALVADFYRAGAPGIEPYRRAQLSFLRWTIARGALGDPATGRPGSPWWQAVNGRLLTDMADARTGAAAAGTSAAAWTAFLERPSPAGWYRAHNASVVAGYLDSEALAEPELPVERFLMNAALLRALYAHALVAHPRLALGRLAAAGPRLADPRGATVDLFLNLGRAFPEIYPVAGVDLDTLLASEGRFGRLLDYGVIGPRLTDLYAFSAASLGEPRLMALIDEGVPCYCWPATVRDPWLETSQRRLPRLVYRTTRPRD